MVLKRPPSSPTQITDAKTISRNKFQTETENQNDTTQITYNSKTVSRNKFQLETENQNDTTQVTNNPKTVSRNKFQTETDTTQITSNSKTVSRNKFQMETENQNDTMTKQKRKELGFSCMLNTEIGAVLAVIRRAPDLQNPYYSVVPNQDEIYDSVVLQSLKSLRSLIFNPQQEWRTIDPSMYLAPFLDVIQSDNIPAPATGVAISSVLKILKLEVFDEKTPGAKEAINLVVSAITCCRLERVSPGAEEVIMMRILQVLTAVMKHRASALLPDQAICTVVNTSFQVLQQAASRGDLLKRTARYTMHELIQTIFSYLPDIAVKDGENTDSSDTEENDLDSGFSVKSAVDIFRFLCSLLNVVEVVDAEGLNAQAADEDVQIFALVLINSALEQSGDSIGSHPKLLKMVQDDLCHHLIHYGTCSSPLILSMICSTFLNIYYFIRRSVRLQLEAFFSFVLLRVVNLSHYFHLQEVAVEGIINFCRQPTFIIEAYVNYDCDPLLGNIFEDVGKVLCKHAFPTGGPLTSLQIQAFEGLVVIIHNIADNVDKDNDSTPSTPYPVDISEYRPFWEEKQKKAMGLETWVDFVRVRKLQKRKLLIAANHFNRDEKKGLEYLKIAKLISNQPDPKAYAIFFRYTFGLDKTMIGDYLGDPDEFHLKVLKEFTDTFDFSGMILDVALRTFLETFRLPGESQKITRILEAFSEKFYEQQSTDIFAHKDAAFVLCYSLIMLNTDQHNHQVKKKMTEEEFIRNNRAINDGKDLPREYLSELFYSISTNAITLFGQTGTIIEMNPSRWIELLNRSKLINPYLVCDFDRRLGRDMFSTIAGPCVSTLSSIFEQTDEEELLNECIEGLFSIARIAQYGLEDILDEILASFCKFTTLLNPYASADETLYAFSHDTKPKLATLAVFTIANIFGESIRGGWRNIVDCLLKLKRLKLLPQSIHEPEAYLDSTKSPENDSQGGPGHNRVSSGLIGRFSQFLSMESVEENLNLGLSEHEQNVKIIQQCQIGRVFSNSSKLPNEPLINLGRSLIFSAAGKGQKFSTPVEEEETVGFCWDLLLIISVSNIHRFMSFWPQYHDFLIGVIQFPLFSPVPFAEKAIIAIVKVCLKLLSSYNHDKRPEELVFKSINLMWKLDKEIVETCGPFLTQSINKIITEYPGNLQSSLGWKSTLHLLSIIGRHPETYELGVKTLISLMSNGNNMSRANYAYCIDCAFSFVALRNTPLETNIRIMDLMSDSVNHLIHWARSGYSDPGSSFSIPSSTSLEDTTRLSSSSSHYTVDLFIRLGESLRKTSLARREEVRNHAVMSLKKGFLLADDLYFTPVNCINCFNLVVFAMVDDLHEKMLEYSRRENAEREMRSMEGTLKIAMELMTEVYLQFLKTISESSGFRTFWLGILRRMDTFMKAELGEYGTSSVQEIVPDLLKKMITTMQENEILVKREGDDLWEITYIQIQWIAPSLKDELFPDE